MLRFFAEKRRKKMALMKKTDHAGTVSAHTFGHGIAVGIYGEGNFVIVKERVEVHTVVRYNHFGDA